MKLSNFLSIIFISLAFTATTVSAENNSHNNAANTLLNTMNINLLLEESIEGMMQLELSRNPQLKPFEETMRGFFKKHMSGESLRQEFIALYTKTFSEDELIEINNFYKTKTGQKALKTAPGLMMEGAKIGQKRVQDNLPELQKMIKEEAQRIQSLQNSQQ